MEPIITQTKDRFDKWQEKLHDFVKQHQRSFTATEWKWMRYQFALENSECDDIGSLRMAADGTTLNQNLSVETAKTDVAQFSNERGDIRLSITVRPGVSNEKIVYFKLTDEEGRPIPGCGIRFPGILSEVRSDDHGRAKLDYSTYRDYIKSVMHLELIRKGMQPEILGME